MIPRWKLKDCPRCGGDIFMDIDENGWLGHCLQCGYMGRAAARMPEPLVREVAVFPKSAAGAFARPVR